VILPWFSFIRAMKLFKLLLLTQATYIMVTAVWPIIDIESFMFVTGPKTDVWLVKTVGALLIPVALCMYSYRRTKTVDTPIIILGIGIAAAFISVDVYYSTSDVISDIYLIDAALEILFLVGWVFCGYRYFKPSVNA
jgi:hypothetical protein